MDLLNAIILGVVEGLTEFLPVSSTGHLILASRLLGLEQTDFLKSFEIAIQLGAILAVVVLYWRSLLFDISVLKRVLAAFLPTAIVGFVFYKLIKKFLIGNSQVVVWSLLLGGIGLIIFELVHKEKKEALDKLESISYRNAFLIGLFQSCAVIPGVSRSAATIIGGLLLGLNRKTIVEFSFLLAVPTMLAATLLDLLKSAGSFSPGQLMFLPIGFLTSFVVAIGSIKFFLHFIKTHNFIPFGIYRISAAIIFLISKI